MASPNKPRLALLQSTASVSMRTPPGMYFYPGLGWGVCVCAFLAVFENQPAVHSCQTGAWSH